MYNSIATANHARNQGMVNRENAPPNHFSPPKIV